MRTAAVALAAAAVLAGCNPRPDEGPVTVSVIGHAAQFMTASPRNEPDRVVTGAVAMGLVRFDAAGQIEPGLAERWIVIDGGLRYIFRLRSARWSDDRPVSAQQLVVILKRRLRDPANPLLPYLSAIDDIVQMTPQVLEVRLSRPRPDLLKLFAQPELAIVRQRPAGGGGPFRVVEGARPLRLTPLVDPNRAPDDAPRPTPEDDVELIGERAARAVARFQQRHSDLVLGGTFDDWPMVTAAGIAPANIRTDPTAGLFGLVVARRSGLLAAAADRAALAGAIDRTAIVASLPAGTPTADAVLPERLDSAASPVQPAWASVPLANRRAEALRRVAAYRSRTGTAPVLSVALPPGPGARALHRRLRFAWGSIGIDVRHVPLASAQADLRLIDRVAPYDSARWYLREACAPCGAEAEAAIEAARIAPSANERARALALADAALDADAAFIPLSRPIRWSLVSLRLQAFQRNSRAWHPLDHLRNDPDR